MKRGLVIVHLVLLGCTCHLFAQEKSNEATITNKIDQFLLAHQIEPDSLILIGNWSNSDGFSSSYIEVKTDGRFKSGGLTCFGKYGGKGRWYIKDGQLILKKRLKQRKQIIYANYGEYLLLEEDSATRQEIKILATDIYSDKTMSEEDLWRLVSSMVLVKHKD